MDAHSVEHALPPVFRLTTTDTSPRRQIWLYGTVYASPRPLKDTLLCNAGICMLYGLAFCGYALELMQPFFITILLLIAHLKSSYDCVRPLPVSKINEIPRLKTLPVPEKETQVSKTGYERVSVYHMVLPDFVEETPP